MDEIEDQSMLGISQREKEKLIQVKEGKGIQEEEGLTKSKFLILIYKGISHQEGILDTLRHLKPNSSRVPHLPLKSYTLAAQSSHSPFNLGPKSARKTHSLSLPHM